MEITTATGGCGYVNISWSTTYNADDFSVIYYDATLSYVTNDDHMTVSMATTMMSSIFTGLPPDTQINITLLVIGIEQVVLGIDSTTVSTVAFESMYSIYVHSLIFYKLIVLFTF